MYLNFANIDSTFVNMVVAGQKPDPLDFGSGCGSSFGDANPQFNLLNAFSIWLVN